MSDTAARLEGGGGFLERYFKFGQHGTTLGRDTMAGVTTFIVMSYIIFVNPQILSFAGIPALSDQGLPFNEVLAATCLVAGVTSRSGRSNTPSRRTGSGGSCLLLHDAAGRG